MRGTGTLRVIFACAALFAALSGVVYRQSRALEVLRELDAARSDRAIAESERAALQRQIQELEGRARIVQVAGERLGLRPPSASELVILRVPAGRADRMDRDARVALARGVS